MCSAYINVDLSISASPTERFLHNFSRDCRIHNCEATCSQKRVCEFIISYAIFQEEKCISSAISCFEIALRVLSFFFKSVFFCQILYLKDRKQTHKTVNGNDENLTTRISRIKVVQTETFALKSDWNKMSCAIVFFLY